MIENKWDYYNYMKLILKRKIFLHSNYCFVTANNILINREYKFQNYIKYIYLIISNIESFAKKYCFEISNNRIFPITNIYLLLYMLYNINDKEFVEKLIYYYIIILKNIHIPYKLVNNILK